jgi:RNA polymerase sigma-70 factor, ECF subfamily
MTAPEDRIDELYRRVFGFHLRLAGGVRTEAEELTQETMLRVLRSKEALRDPEKLVFWALKIAARIRIDTYRRRPHVALNPGMEEGGPAIEPGQGEESSRALKLLSALPEPYRTSVSLRYVQGLGYEEMASILELPEGTVKSHVARGLRLIRRGMESNDELH